MSGLCQARNACGATCFTTMTYTPSAENSSAFECPIFQTDGNNDCSVATLLAWEVLRGGV
jgi:hypothetical protein